MRLMGRRELNEVSGSNGRTKEKEMVPKPSELTGHRCQ